MDYLESKRVCAGMVIVMVELPVIYLNQNQHTHVLDWTFFLVSLIALVLIITGNRAARMARETRQDR
ncbi:hypothetical protein [Acidipila sp. EB88]|uniref:hypothetical protein n=1 Tax=Acidipila sp. EB88 TaxID=2305226 RepID=UPI0011CF89C1|nr:hypothetical protein [Acidipila sp. EB88]